jgi:hypothetical protein
MQFVSNSREIRAISFLSEKQPDWFAVSLRWDWIIGQNSAQMNMDKRDMNGFKNLDWSFHLL